MLTATNGVVERGSVDARLKYLRSLHKEPPKKAAKTLSATGSSSVLEIVMSYSLPTKNKTCSLTKEAMIQSILRHEVRLKYKGNLGHDDWRSLRAKNGPAASGRNAALVANFGFQLSSTDHSSHTSFKRASYFGHLML